MDRIFLFLAILTFSVAVFAKVPVKQLTERELDSETVIGVLQKYNSDIIRGMKDKKPLSALRYYSFTNAIDKRWIKYRWFIADTGLSIKWLKKIYDLLKYMQKTKSYMELATFGGKTKTSQYQKAVGYFNTAQVRLMKLINKPVRVSGKVLRRAKQQKAAWEKAMKKREK